MKTSICLIIIATLALSDCVSSGRQITDQEMQSFVVGTTTLSDIENKLGTPNSSTEDAQGVKQITYIYTHASAKAESFIPIAGAFVGGVNSNSNVVTFMFGPTGVLTNYNKSQGQNDLRTGLSNGSN